MTKLILEKMNYGYKKDGLKDWKKFSKKIKELKEKVKIGIVGKYFATGDFVLEDSYVSVIEAIKHACYANNVLPDIQWINADEFEKDPKKISELKKYNGVIVPGGFGKTGVEGKIKTVKYCRENKIPYLGICYGLQMAVIEYARNVCKLDNATTTEVDKRSPNPIIDILPEQKELLEKKKYGASMRLGNYTAKLQKGSLISKLYNSETAIERHRHRYEVNPNFHNILDQNGLIVSGMSPDRKLVEYIEIDEKKHPFFIATQAHPEFTSRPEKPNPLFLGFIKASKNN
jgi:CTP synthase